MMTCMATTTDTRAEIEALKTEYFRHLDNKMWNELAELFTDDACAAYDDGTFLLNGRDAIIGFLKDALGDETCHSTHQGELIDLQVLGNQEVAARWAFTDRIDYSQAGWQVEGAGTYHDRYIRTTGSDTGGWKIAHTSYERDWETRRRA